MTSGLVEERDRWRRIGGALVSGVGVVTAAIHGYHFLASAPDSVPAIVYGIVLPLCLSLALISAGGWLIRSDITGKHAIRVVVWSVTGAVVFTISGVLMVRYQQAEGVMMSDKLFVLIDSITGGMVIGFAFGLYATRIKRQTAQLDRYQHRLERERDRFVALFDNLPDPAVQYEQTDTNDTPVVRVVNPAFERTFDVDGVTIDGTPVDEIITPADQQTPIDLETVLHASELVEDEIRLKTTTGIREFQLLVIPPGIATTDRTGHIIATDITDRKQYVRRLEVLNRVLRHDLRNYAGVIIGNCDLLTDDASNTDNVETIHETAYKLVELGETVQQIEHALDRNSKTNGTIALFDVLRECVDRARSEHPNAEIRTELPEKRTRISANKQIDSVFDNVIENAIEHNDSARPIVSVTVTTDSSGFVTIEIADNGPGVPDREQQVLEEGTETQIKHSLGLGLWVVHWLVIDSGGSVGFEDNDPHGSIVTIDLPKVDADESETTDGRTVSTAVQ